MRFGPEKLSSKRIFEEAGFSAEGHAGPFCCFLSKSIDPLCCGARTCRDRATASGPHHFFPHRRMTFRSSTGRLFCSIDATAPTATTYTCPTFTGGGARDPNVPPKMVHIVVLKFYIMTLFYHNIAMGYGMPWYKWNNGTCDAY